MNKQTKVHMGNIFIKARLFFRKLQRRVGGLIKNLLFIILLVNMYKYFGVYGLFVGALGFTLLIIIFRWKHFVMAMQYTESKIWGDPLDRIYWKNKKLPKVKIVWRKKKNGKSKKLAGNKTQV